MIVFENFPVLYQLNSFKHDFLHVYPHSDSYQVNETLLNIILFMYFHIKDHNGSKFTLSKPTKIIFLHEFPIYLDTSSVLNKTDSNHKIKHQGKKFDELGDLFWTCSNIFQHWLVAWRWGIESTVQIWNFSPDLNQNKTNKLIKLIFHTGKLS